jgi:hypothetical protein
MKLKNLFSRDDEATYLQQQPEEECCGQHKVCEKDLLLKAAAKSIEYYDDEELDVFAGRLSDSYTGDETELFAEVLHTMWESDVPGWVRSLQLRGIELPHTLRDEVLLILNG